MKTSWRKYLRPGILAVLQLAGNVAAQSDSVILNEVIIRAYPGNQTPVLKIPSSVILLDSSSIFLQHGQSLVPALNTAAGVRMEERSPGSYRLSIRGSMLRSPFGIRNAKIYLDELPFTNAGGETYLNVLDPGAIHQAEILKGPDGSLFGANSGGVVRLGVFDPKKDSAALTAGTSVGSYRQSQNFLAFSKKLKQNLFSGRASWQFSDGYREHSKLDRKFLSLGNRSVYQKGELRLYLFYADLRYQTPGGLTLEQFSMSPRSARPPSALLPGAVRQQAGVVNRTFFAGAVNDYDFSARLKYVFAVFSSGTRFENPFITNYEVRRESNMGVRSWVNYIVLLKKNITLKVTTGGEMQMLDARVGNYGNVKGRKDSLQAYDDFRVEQGFIFLSTTASIAGRFHLEGSLSYNMNTMSYRRISPDTVSGSRFFDPQVMPRVAASYLLHKRLSFRALVSRGYSVPTLQEIRSSDYRVNTALEPEAGWNAEAGLRLRTLNDLLHWDVAAFYFKLEKAIVRRLNDAGQEFFENTGSTVQPGIESQIRINALRRRSAGPVRVIRLTQATQYYAFRFGTYINTSGDFSGNRLTGVAGYVFVNGLYMEFPYRMYIFLQHHHSTGFPLNDANSAFAEPYHTALIKTGGVLTLRGADVSVSAGMDNVLDARYSSGHDLNAAGGRYFNPAPGRNVFLQLQIRF